jgi:hypothetical protein
MDELEWPRLTNILLELLRSFTRLHKLKLKHINCKAMPIIEMAFLKVLTLPSLLHFEIEDVKFLTVDEFSRLLCPHLKRLAMYKISLQYPNGLHPAVAHTVEGKQETAQRRQLCHLEYLELSADSCSRFTKRFLGAQPIFDISCLRTLYSMLQIMVGISLMDER